MLKKIWYIWANTMGNRISANTNEADIAAIIRTIWWFTHIITCFFIIAGIIRHWNHG